MLKLPKEYHDKEILYRRLILFTLSLGLIVVYMPRILGLIGTAIWVCLPFIIGTFLAFVLNTFCKVLMRFGRYTLKIEHNEKYLPVYRILTLLILLGFVTLLLVFIIPQLISSVEHLATEFPAYLTRLVARIYDYSERFPMVRDWLDQNNDLVSDVPNLLGKVSSFLFAGTAGTTLENIQGVLSNTFSWIWIMFLAVAFSIIAFFNSTTFIKESRMIAKAYMPPRLYRDCSRLTSLIVEIFTQYIGGTVLECIILATLVSVFGLIFQIPYAVLIGVFCGICALVPMFGATAGAVLCTMLLLMQSPGKALTFLIMFICIQQVEGNFIYPNVVGKSVGLPPMFVIVAITIGASMAGILGMIISIPVASVIYALILDQAKNRMVQKQSDGGNPLPAENN